MTGPYIEKSPAWVYNSDEEGVYWVVTCESDGPTARAMFYTQADAEAFVLLVMGITEEIAVVEGEDE